MRWKSLIFYFKGIPKFISGPSDITVTQYQEARFECVIDALPKANLVWLLNGKEITKDDVKFEVNEQTSTYYYIIPKVLTTHGGVYTIKATNDVGENEYKFKLDVFGKLLFET